MSHHSLSSSTLQPQFMVVFHHALIHHRPLHQPSVTSVKPPSFLYEVWTLSRRSIPTAHWYLYRASPAPLQPSLLLRSSSLPSIIITRAYLTLIPYSFRHSDHSCRKAYSFSTMWWLFWRLPIHSVTWPLHLVSILSLSSGQQSMSYSATPCRSYLIKSCKLFCSRDFPISH